jgi:hypothetical protein
MRDHVRFQAATVITIMGLLVAGCGGTGPTSTSLASPSPGATDDGDQGLNVGPTPSKPATAAPAASPARADGRPARCHTAQLAGRVRMLDAAAGNRYAALVLTNTSSGTCRTYGFVGLRLTGPNGTKPPTTVVRETQPSPHGITLRPGQSAWTRMHWTVASGTGEPAAGLCEPEPTRLLVIPPDERTQLAASWPSGSVCEHGKIFVTALSLGTG